MTSTPITEVKLSNNTEKANLGMYIVHAHSFSNGPCKFELGAGQTLSGISEVWNSAQSYNARLYVACTNQLQRKVFNIALFTWLGSWRRRDRDRHFA
jgi:hypothetical protein